ncbi:MAG: methyltransferase [Candidatus Woesearchaeota archaeon]|nr:methyltransferase [Candidatus Woesearchaeota archaeon]
MIPILTKKTADKILKAKAGKGAIEVTVSLDLGLSSSKVIVEGESVIIDRIKIALSDIKRIKEDFCYYLNDGKLEKVAFFSPESNLYYKLSATKDWPTIKLSSVPMHRHIKISPKEDTETKIKEIMPVKGTVLDTCCGLGYTAIMASNQPDAVKVDVFERDDYVLHIAGLNPYSQALFSSKKIELHKEDVSKGIKKFKDESFDKIIHDPPTFRISPDLYYPAFYKQLYRVMKKGGILYHYAPNPGKTKGNEFYKLIIRTLMESTKFKDIEYHEASSGIRAVK